MKKRVRIFDASGRDISNECELKNGKGNPFGWSQHEIFWHGHSIGFIESGEVSLTEGFSHTETPEE